MHYRIEVELCRGVLVVAMMSQLKSSVELSGVELSGAESHVPKNLSSFETENGAGP